MGINEKEKETDDISEGPLRQRPFQVFGSSYRLQTPVGTAFITINQDESGDPLEIFINVGKAGSDVAAMAEALGRTISTSLRLKGILSAKDRAYEIAKQLTGIGGRRSVGFGPNKIRSLPDAIAFAFAAHYGFKLNGGNHAEALYSNGEAGAVMVASNTALNGQHPLSGDSSDPVTAPAVKNSQGEGSLDAVGVFLERPGDICPSCGASALVYEEGCSKCHVCGHSEC